MVDVSYAMKPSRGKKQAASLSTSFSSLFISSVQPSSTIQSRSNSNSSPAKNPSLPLARPSSWRNTLSRRTSRRFTRKRKGLSEWEGMSPTERLSSGSDWTVAASSGFTPHQHIPNIPTNTSQSTDCLQRLSVQSDSPDFQPNPDWFPPQSGCQTLDRHWGKRAKTDQQTDRHLHIGVKQFNLEPSRGLKYLEESGLISPNSVKATAHFLHSQPRLSKKKIGEYLGSHREFNTQVLGEFVECHRFKELLLVQALRQFFWSFRLPGEALQIDRIMDAFARHYCRENPHIFQNADTCYILSFSIIMLNTVLHNPNSNIKITQERFVQQNREIDAGADLPQEMLEAIYRNIKEEPLKIPEENYYDQMYTFFFPVKEGNLLKQGGSWKTWKRRFFVLNEKCLYYFTTTADTVPKGIIPLENVLVRSLEQDIRGWMFEIYTEQKGVIKGCKTDSSGAVVQGKHKYYRMAANTEEERDEWVKAIQHNITDNPFQKIIQQKKRALKRSSSTGLATAANAASRKANISSCNGHGGSGGSSVHISECEASSRSIDTGICSSATSSKSIDTGISSSATSRKSVGTEISSSAISRKSDDTGISSSATSSKSDETGLCSSATSSKSVDTEISSSVTSRKSVDTGISSSATIAGSSISSSNRTSMSVSSCDQGEYAIPISHI